MLVTWPGQQYKQYKRHRGSHQTCQPSECHRCREWELAKRFGSGAEQGESSCRGGEGRGVLQGWKGEGGLAGVEKGGGSCRGGEGRKVLQGWRREGESFVVPQAEAGKVLREGEGSTAGGRQRRD